MENAQMNNNEEQQTRSPTAPLDKEGGGTAALVETNDAQDCEHLVERGKESGVHRSCGGRT